MAAVDKNRLSPPQETCNSEYPVTPERPSSSAIDLPSVNTDNLPITPLQNIKWPYDSTFIVQPYNETLESPFMFQNNVQMMSPAHSLQNSPCLPNTDNLLDISVQRPSLLGKEQAKKRLHAFSLTKPNNLSVSPLTKKNMRQSKFLLQPAEEKYDENGEKTEEKFVLVKKPNRQSINPNEKAKAVVEEIEEIKKLENAYLEGLLNKKNKRVRSNSKLKEKISKREYKKSYGRDNSRFRKSLEGFKYPSGWTEMKAKGFTLESLLQIRSRNYKRPQNISCSDFRKQLLFQTPSLPLQKLSIKAINGKERTIPFEYIRYTTKNPRISYSARESNPNDLFSRKTVLEYVPRSYREIIKKVTNKTTPSEDSQIVPKLTSRQWYPKAILNKLESSTERTPLENFLGLSFVQSYSNVDEKYEKKETEISGTDLKLEYEKTKLSGDLDKENIKSTGEREMDHKMKEKQDWEKNVESEPKILTTNVAEVENDTVDNQMKEETGRIAEIKIPQPIKQYSTKSYNQKKPISVPKEKNTEITENVNRQSNEEESSQNAKKPTGKIENDSLIKTTVTTTKKDSNPDDKQNEKREKSATKQNLTKDQKKNESTLKKEKSVKKKKKSLSEKKLEETRKVKCVAEKEFGTPDTEEYYSNWESDLELTSFEKPTKSSALSRSWETDEEEESLTGFHPVRSRSLEKRNLKDMQLNRKDKSPERGGPKKFSFRDDRTRHSDNFALETMSARNDLSPFRNRVEERRRSRHSAEKHSPGNYLEMPLNIKTTKKSYARNKWDEERFKDDGDFNLRNSFGSNKLYSLYTEDSWEKEDYLTIKTEEMRLEEERRTLIEERRQLEVERRKFEELEWQRYCTKLEEERCIANEKKMKSLSNVEERTHRDYREDRNTQKSYRENDVSSSNKHMISEDSSSHKKHVLEQFEQKTNSPIDGGFDWEGNVERRRQKHETESKGIKRNRKSRWHDDDIDLVQHAEVDEYQSPVTQNKDSVSVNEIEQENKRSLPGISEREKETPPPEQNTGSKELNISESMTDNLNVQPMHKLKNLKRPSSSVYKPQLLENEYEKFMQSLGSEVNLMKKHKSKQRSSSASFDGDYSTASKDIQKRRSRTKSSSSSSSSGSSNSSDSDTSSGSSYSSSSSESNYERKRKLRKIKQESTNVVQEKMVDVMNTFDVEVKPKVVIKLEEDITVSPHSLEFFGPTKIKGRVNLNIIDISPPKLSPLDEIPLPSPETPAFISKSMFPETPLPVPSPAVVVRKESSDAVLDLSSTTIHTDEALSKPCNFVEPSHQISVLTDANVYPQVTMDDALSQNEKELPQTDMTLSPMKRNNLIPIKFLTAELRKLANDVPLKTVEPASETTNTVSFEKGDSAQLLPLTNRKRYFALSSINLPTKTAEEFHEDDSNSADFTERFVRKDENDGDSKSEETSTYSNKNKSDTFRERSVEREKRSSIERKKRNSISPYLRRTFSRNRRGSRSPRRYGPVKKRIREVSPRRKNRRSPSPARREGSPRRWRRGGFSKPPGRDRPMRRHRDSISPKRHSISPRRRSASPKRRSISPRRRSISPRRRSMSPRQRSISPRRRDHRSMSPKRRRSPNNCSLSRDRSPWRRLSKDRSTSRERKYELMLESSQKTTLDHDKYGRKGSPMNSPIHGFKRSIADSTISDDQLLQHNLVEYADSPHYGVGNYYRTSGLHSPSPRRISLDERINQALGIAEEEPKPISTTYSENFIYDQSYFDLYGQYYEQYNVQKRETSQYREERQRSMSNLKVVQVGNVLQVVPTEDAYHNQAPVQQNTVTNSTQGYVQVGNMLQIVPTSSPEKSETPVVSTSTLTSTTVTSVAPTKEDLNAEALIKQKMARRAEKEKRRQERERKRKEKEKKKKERERRKQMKIKLHTEAMIKQALILETEEVSTENEENRQPSEDGNDARAQWPPIPQIVFNSASKTPGKGILCQSVGGGSSKAEKVHSESYPPERTKCVKFSDGVMPGEGTSPSGGEELSSPPPTPRKLPKEKRFKKTKMPKKPKVPKKKKVKVKVIRQHQQQVQCSEDDDEDEQDNLPPPPPPPGSPPPHIFPARIKPPIINNTHPSMVVSLANSALQGTDVTYPPPTVYRSVMMPHHRVPHIPPPGLLHAHNNHPPPPPMHHGAFIPTTIAMSPAHILPSVVVPPAQSHHGGHHHHLHHQSPHHSHHLH